MKEPDQIWKVAEKAIELIADNLVRERNLPGGETSSNTLFITSALGLLNASAGKFAEAETLLLQVMELLGRRYAPGTQGTGIWDAKSQLAWVQFHLQKTAQAESTLRDVRRNSLLAKNDTFEHFHYESLLGAVLAAQQKYPEAEEHLVRAAEGMLQRTARPESGFIGTFSFEAQPGERIVKLYQDWGKPDQAAEWQRRFQGRVTTERSDLKMVSSGQPVYPPQARRQRVEGIVRLEITVGADRSVRDVRAATGHALLVPGAVETVRRSKFEIPLGGGQPADRTAEVELRFRLKLR